MDQDFWLDRWQNNEIGFHADEINPHFQNFWHSLQLSPGNRVFVPLCGKSKDMLWLRAQGYPVMAVELSPLAISAFFRENSLTAHTTQTGKFTITQDIDLSLYCGDFFDLKPEDFRGISAIYDRAALVALPAELSEKYVEHLKICLPTGVKTLLISFDYNQQEMAGPPFSVPPSEVSALFGSWCNIEALSSEDILEQEPRFKARGLTHLQEQVYLLTVK